MNRRSTGRARRVEGSNDEQHSAVPFRLEPPRRRVQVPQLLIAVFLVAVSALAAVVLFSRAAAREPVLALANPVERGQVVTASDLMVVYVASDDPITSLPGEASSGLVGLTAVADLEAGTIVTPAHFAARSLLDSGEGVVGLALAPGEYPTPLLAPGDVVDVVLTDGGTSEAGAFASGPVVSSAEVFDVAELGTQGQRFISLRMPAEAAAEVARAAAAGGRVRLVLVAGTDR